MSNFWKLTPVITVATVVALLLAGVLLGVYNEESYKAQKIDEVSVQARILASTVTAALAFNDRAAAQEYVNALNVNPEVQAVGVYDAAGGLFASYARGDHAPPATVRVREPYFAGDRLIVVAPVTQGDASLGTIYVQTTTEPLSRRLERYGAVVLLVTMAALVIAVLGIAQRALTRANATLTNQASDLAQANRNLQAEMKERERAEEALRQSQKMEAVGQLTSGIAHDFNNLLTGVIGHIELVLARTRDEAIERSLRSAARAADRGAKLTQQLLAFARRQHLQARPVDLNALVRGMEDMLARSIGPVVRIDLALAPDLWPALVDASQVEVAILNLAINARDAMPFGGRLVVETANVPVDAPRRPSDLPPGDEFVLVAVSDTGTGMDAATLARAFEPFFTTKEVGKGTGLGLSQIYGLAKQSGGSAEIESAPGQGTIVRLYLPRASLPLAAVLPEPVPARKWTGAGQPASKRRILLVDDDPDVREVTAAMLRGEGHAVVEAGNGRAALEILDAGEPFDALVADYAMPSMTGAELAREARRRRPALPTLLITGYAEAGSLAGTADLDVVLRKPFRQSELVAAVAEAVRR